jgi:predicted metalloprotease with PDZ domain
LRAAARRVNPGTGRVWPAVAALLALTAGVRPATAQEPRDTLLYDIAIGLAPAHFSVEGRLTVAQAGNVVLAAPPSARPAGTDVAGFLATDDRGIHLPTQRSTGRYVLEARSGAVRFRYRLDFQNAVAMSATGAGLDSVHLYAVGRSVFLAPDPAAYRKTSRTYPVVFVHVTAPPEWHVVTSWGVDQDLYAPATGEALVGATLAAAADFRVYRDTAGGVPFVLAIRGSRHFSDSALVAVIAASLAHAVAVLGPAPVPVVTYTSDLGDKGRTSGSLQGQSSVGLIWEPGELLERARGEDLFHETLHLWFGGAMEADRWWIEGVTDYYAARLYAEWTGRSADLSDLCYESLRNYLDIEHNTRMTMEEEERGRVIGDNTALLVYRKGMLAGLLLDAAIRRGTDGQASLDDVARRTFVLAAERRSHAVRGNEIRDIAIETGGGSVGRVWDRVVAGANLISEDEVTEALHVVAGGNAPAPPLRAKEQKVLSHHPKQ